MIMMYATGTRTEAMAGKYNSVDVFDGRCVLAKFHSVRVMCVVLLVLEATD